MNEEVESAVLDDAGDGASSAVDSEPVAADASVTEETSDPVEVISVDELLDRLTVDEEVTEEETAVEEETAPEPEVTATLDDVVQHLEVIETRLDRPMLITPFEDYTVTEGLLLLALLAAFVSVCFKMLKEGFSWLN